VPYCLIPCTLLKDSQRAFVLDPMCCPNPDFIGASLALGQVVASQSQSLFRH
jgi:hypothetical protein